MFAQVSGISVSWDFNTFTLVAIAVHFIGGIIYLVKTRSAAVMAQETAASAQKRADDAHASLAAHQAAFNLFQIQVASDYVDRAALREMEGRIRDDFIELRDRIEKVLARALDGQGKSSK